jgi:tetratricopeptide (TPR) repeat protein
VLADRRRVLGPHHPDTFDTRTVFAMARLRHGRLLDAVNELGRIRDEAIIHLGPAHLQAIIPTGLYVNLLTKAGRGREAITVIEEMTKASWAGDVRSDHPYVHVGRAMLIDAYLQAGRTSEAKMLAEAARTRPGAEAMRSTLIAAGFGRLGAGRGNDAVLLFEWGIAGEASESETRLEGLSGLAHAYRALGRNQDEVPIREQILAGWRQRKPEDDPLVLDAIREFGAALIGAGRREEGTELLEELIPRLRKTLGPEHPQTLSALQTLSNSSSGQRAVELAGEVVAAHRKGLLKTRELSNALANLGTGLLKTGKPAEGEAALREAMEIQLAIDREGWVAALRRASHGWALLELKRYPEAEAQLLAGYREMSERVSIMPAYHANHPQYTAKRLVRLYEETGKPKEADAWRAKVEQHRRERKKPDPAPTPPKKQDDAEPKSPPTATKPPADRAPTKPADSASHAPIHKPQPGAKPMDKPADQPVPAGGAAKPS